MTDLIVEIMVELLSVLALATKEIRQGRFSEYLFLQIPPKDLMYYREIHKEIAGKERG